MRGAGLAIGLVATASALTVCATFVPGVTLTLGGLVVATPVVVLPEEFLGYRMDDVSKRRKSREDPELARADLLIFMGYAVVSIAFIFAAVPFADLAATGFDIDGPVAYFVTTGALIGASLLFTWMTPWAWHRSR